MVLRDGMYMREEGLRGVDRLALELCGGNSTFVRKVGIRVREDIIDEGGGSL